MEFELLTNFWNMMTSVETLSPAFVIGLVMVNNFIVHKLCRRQQDKAIHEVNRANHAERLRACETINALRGVIYAFSDAQAHAEEAVEKAERYNREV